MQLKREHFLLLSRSIADSQGRRQKQELKKDRQTEEDRQIAPINHPQPRLSSLEDGHNRGDFTNGEHGSEGRVAG
ncbi:hypothetical protein SKAU_G00052200 [Synaphobranchus kaupii]|uniref:Uncharacterized protein n=1 Tax=Synaphobranchus kaupii TaxID=118154 RepID=A0A9Q1J9W2_SYNKA|nr:hypothetical protein SKAU_G00052200 [Synaphobranchus kaupii]